MLTGRRLGYSLLALLLPAFSAQAQTDPYLDPYRHARDDPPPGWTGPFQLSRNYPTTKPAAETLAWKGIDYTTQPEQYLSAVLQYCLDGNTDAAIDWRQHLKTTGRIWYHAPWLHGSKRNGREFINGLTQERVCEVGDLHPQQTEQVQNWAVSLYNPLGGYVLGQVWNATNAPDVSNVRFDDGTVAVKLLFTAATDTQVPFLTGAKEWDAHLGAWNPMSKRFKRTNPPHVAALGQGTAPVPATEVHKVRLLQVDVAVRDERPGAPTGWVFGTFIYNGNATGLTPYDKLVPVGLMWGNDEGVTEAGVAASMQTIQQSWLNPAAKPLMTHYGWAGRLNGPVDNRKSSCISCHSTAESPKLARLTPPDDPMTAVAEILRWFRNIKAGDPFSASGTKSLDYSLQLSEGILNQQMATGAIVLTVREGRPLFFTREGQRVFPIKRGGGADFDPEDYGRLLERPRGGELDRDKTIPRPEPQASAMTPFFVAGGVCLLVGAGLAWWAWRRRAG